MPRLPSRTRRRVPPAASTMTRPRLVANREAIRRAAGIAFLVALASWTCNADAQTSGPTQPEFQSIAGAKALEFLNPFTGDLHYTISLFDLPGPNGKFPFVLEYQSG